MSAGHGVTLTMTAAAMDVLVERQRQVDEERFDRAHDDQHSFGVLAQAAACYAAHVAEFYHRGCGGRPYWPFDMDWWKPKSPRTDLVRAAALILAEIERLDRKRP